MAVNNLNTPGVGIQPSIVDAKGDLIAGTAADAVGRLAVGTNGQVLVADSGETTGLKWNDPGSVGGLVHINTTAITAVSAVSLNNVFSASYRHYRILIDYDPGSTTYAFIRLRASGSDDTANNYAYNLSAQNTDNAHTVQGAGTFFGLQNSTSGGYSPLWVDLMNPFEAANTFITTSQWIDNAQTITAGAKQTSTSYDGFSLVLNAGSFSAVGKIQVYGYKD